jgi:hypothetical protein
VKLICIWIIHADLEQRLEAEAICDKEWQKIKWPMELNFMEVCMEGFLSVTIPWSAFSDQASALPILFILFMCILVIRSINMVFMSRIWSPHNGGYGDFYFLASNAVYYIESQLMFWRNMSLPASESYKSNKKPAWNVSVKTICHWWKHS